MKYLFIGNGNVSKNLFFYFKSLGVDCSVWSRSLSSEKDLRKQVDEASIILLALPDKALKNVFDEYPVLRKQACFHFSGSFYSDDIKGLHPLMSFAKEEVLSLEVLRKMNFGIDFSLNEFRETFPFLLNPVFEISSEMKTYYHFLCVLTGNFTKYLWQFAKNEFELRFQNSEALIPYLEQTMKEVLSDENFFTGPLERKESEIIKKYHTELKDKKELRDLLSSFYEFRKKEFNEVR